MTIKRSQYLATEILFWTSLTPFLCYRILDIPPKIETIKKKICESKWLRVYCNRLVS
jgi:hypothetical protein